MKRRLSDIRWMPAVVLAAALLLVWEAAVRLFGVPGYVLPPPTSVFAAMFALPGLYTHLLATLLEAVVGLLISIALGAILALLMDAFSWFKRAVHPLLVVSQTVPVVVLAPLLLLYLGFGYAPKIATVVLMCFFPIAVNLSDALGAVPGQLVDCLRLMGATRAQIYTIAKLPGALPGFFSGLRISATYSVMGAVVGEWLGGDRGLGFLMLRLKNAYALDKVFAVIIYIVLTSLALYFAAWTLEGVYRHRFRRKP